jgi:hypothetical protein
MPQLAAAAGFIVLVALLSVGVASIKNGGLGRSAGHPVTSPTATTYRIATMPNEYYLLVRLDTVLQGQANSDGTACLWYGVGAERVAFVWPPGYIARGNPLAVYDGSGALIGVVGKHVSLGGGGGPNGGAKVSVLGCPEVSGVWIVSPNWSVSPK